MTRMKAFQTAAARRRSNPIVWDIDGQQIRLVSSADLASVGHLVEVTIEEMSDDEPVMQFANAKRTKLIDALRAFVVPGDLEAFAQIEPDLDMGILSEMTSEIITEYTGQGNPTQPPSSSDGSSSDGQTSTATAPPEDSTLPL
jgi:hypothetical protein